MKPEKVEELYRRLAARTPEPETELEYANPYTLLVAVVLSAQATDVGVNKATEKLFQSVDTPEAMLTLGEARLKEHIKTIGLFNTKARNVIALSRILVEQHGGEVPRQREALEALPGVGRKTANVVLNVAFGEATIAVDTHIFRVSNRTGLAPGADPLAVETKLEQGHAGPLPPPRPSLADPARPLCVQGAQARLSALRDPRSVRLQAEDGGGAARRRSARAAAAPRRDQALIAAVDRNRLGVLGARLDMVDAEGVALAEQEDVEEAVVAGVAPDLHRAVAAHEPGGPEQLEHEFARQADQADGRFAPRTRPAVAVPQAGRRGPPATCRCPDLRFRAYRWPAPAPPPAAQVQPQAAAGMPGWRRPRGSRTLMRSQAPASRRSTPTPRLPECAVNVQASLGSPPNIVPPGDAGLLSPTGLSDAWPRPATWTSPEISPPGSISIWP